MGGGKGGRAGSLGTQQLLSLASCSLFLSRFSHLSISNSGPGTVPASGFLSLAEGESQGWAWAIPVIMWLTPHAMPPGRSRLTDSPTSPFSFPHSWVRSADSHRPLGVLGLWGNVGSGNRLRSRNSFHLHCDLCPSNIFYLQGHKTGYFINP